MIVKQVVGPFKIKLNDTNARLLIDVGGWELARVYSVANENVTWTTEVAPQQKTRPRPGRAAFSGTAGWTGIEPSAPPRLQKRGSRSEGCEDWGAPGSPAWPRTSSDAATVTGDAAPYPFLADNSSASQSAMSGR